MIRRAVARERARAWIEAWNRRDLPESDIDLLVLTSRLLTWRERDAVTDDLFEIELQHDVVLSILVLPTAEWESGLYRVLPIHEEVERFGVAA